MTDLMIYETSNGGDLYLQNQDLASSELLLQQAYISLFGGNVEASTRGDEIASELRKDWWGNSLIFKEQPEKQFNSQTERTLNNAALTSAGRILIQRAVENDLKHLSSIAKITVEVQIVNSSRVNIYIHFAKLNNQATKTLQFLWDNIKNELINFKTI